MKIHGLVLTVALAALGCSEAREQVVDVGNAVADAVAATDTPTAVDAGVTDVGTLTDRGGGGLVVNEMQTIEGVTRTVTCPVVNL